MRLWSNKRSYAGVNLKRLRRPQSSFYKLVGFPVEMEETTSWLQAKSCITSVILLCFYVPVSVLAKTSWEFKFLQTSIGTEFIKLGRDLYWIDILWSLWFIVLELFGFTSQYSALLLNSAIEVQSYKGKNINRIFLFFSAISVDCVNKRCFSEDFLGFFSKCSEDLRQFSSLEIVGCTQRRDLNNILQWQKKRYVDLLGTAAAVSIKLRTMLVIVLN